MIEQAEKLSVLEIALDIFGKKLKKQKNGEKYKMLCPFHEEKHASFFIIPKGNFYRCYGCGEVGGPVHLVTRTFNDTLGSLIYLEHRGLDLNRDDAKIDTLLNYELEKLF